MSSETHGRSRLISDPVTWSQTRRSTPAIPNQPGILKERSRVTNTYTPFPSPSVTAKWIPSHTTTIADVISAGLSGEGIRTYPSVTLSQPTQQLVRSLVDPSHLGGVPNFVLSMRSRRSPKRKGVLGMSSNSISRKEMERGTYLTAIRY